MKVVIDTNVIVSAVLRGRLPGEVVLFVVGNNEWEWIALREIIDEYLTVIKRPKLKLTAESLNTWIDLINESVDMIDVNIEIHFPRDQKDAKFLACAVVTQAGILITGDRDFEDAVQTGSTKIMSVRKFKEAVIDHWTG